MGDEELIVPRRVLNAGAGPRRRNSLHPCFAGAEWSEVRIDLDAKVDPDVVGSVCDMRDHFADATFDAIWCSHNLEHLYWHEVEIALSEFHRVLKEDGFAVITCPDLQAVAEMLLERGLHAKAYDAPAGPIHVHDIIFGHGASIASGNSHMAHRTGFTQESLGRLALQAGFHESRVGRGDAIDLWAILPMPLCDLDRVKRSAASSRLAFLFPTDPIA